jgi:hypothetical protein
MIDPAATKRELRAHIDEDYKKAHNLWTSIQALVAAGGTGVPTVISPPTNVLSLFTWDAAWHNMASIASYTSSTARWAIISITAGRAASYPDSMLLFSIYGGTTAYITLQTNKITDHAWYLGQVVWIPMDAQQRFAYKFPSNDLSGQRSAYLLGYV